MSDNVQTQAVLDALGHGVLIFSSDGKLIQHNVIAGAILGRDLNMIKSQGWSIAAELFDTHTESIDLRLDKVREQALVSDRPVRFKIYRSGAYIPCWASALNADNGDVYTVLTIDVPDWSIIANVINRFQREMAELVDSTKGHMRLISRTLQLDAEEQDASTARISKRIGGFTRLIEIHMTRGGRLISMLDRLQAIRTGIVRDNVSQYIKRVNLEDYMEDFIEALDEVQLLDPESDQHDYRSRISLELEDDLVIRASESYLTLALRELLRNAIMYSLVGTPIRIVANKRGNAVQIRVQDEGYGIRAKEHDSVFDVFKRARQPQIIAEFGYGLSLHLCKHEVEAMNGQMWFTSEEGVGTTMYLQLPIWQESSSSNHANA